MPKYSTEGRGGRGYSTPSASSGGAAASAGFRFERKYGALLASYILAEMPLPHLMGLAGAWPLWIRFETEAPVDDILVGTSTGGTIAIQAKTSVSLSSKQNSSFAGVIQQFVRHWFVCKHGNGDLDWNRPLDVAKDRLLLVVGPNVSLSISKHLPGALLARSEPGSRQLTQEEKDALDCFDTCAKHAWELLSTDNIPAEMSNELAALVRVVTFDPEDSQTALVLANVAQTGQNVRAIETELESYCGDMMARRGGADSSLLRRSLSTLAIKLESAPSYRNDIQRLKLHTDRVKESLQQYEFVDAGSGGVTIPRDFQKDVNESALTGSLLIVGEPGAGKSGVLNSLTQWLCAQGKDVLALTVDNYSIQSLEGLSSALKLEHSIVDVLESWEGDGQGWLIIDALDAARGGKSEVVYRGLIEYVLTNSTRWNVVASIRTFDLLVGVQYRRLFGGVPPIREHQDARFSNVRHFVVSNWSVRELANLYERLGPLAKPIETGGERLRDLARTPFNTRLLCDLIKADPNALKSREVFTQLSLLKLYWEYRVDRHGTAAKVLLRTAVERMIADESLRTDGLRLAKEDTATYEILRSEHVLASFDDEITVQFSHHLLFDYAASRLFLNLKLSAEQAVVVPKSDNLGLMLAPAAAYSLQELWADDDDHVRFWVISTKLLSEEESDPIIRSVAARWSAELPELDGDTSKLVEAIAKNDRHAILALPHIVGSLVVRIEDVGDIPHRPWAVFAKEVSPYVDRVEWPLRLLCHLLIEKLNARDVYGVIAVAARAVLSYGFMKKVPGPTVQAGVGFVAETYDTDCVLSKELLSQVFSPARKQWISEEIPAVVRKIAPIGAADPEFVVEIYKNTYSTQVDENHDTSMGSSRILPLRSNARQDYEMAAYGLGEYFPVFLAKHPRLATKALIYAVDSYVEREHSSYHKLKSYQVDFDSSEINLQDDFSHIWAHDPDNRFSRDAEVLIAHFRSFLVSASIDNAKLVVSTIINNASLAVYWSRLFLAVVERGDELAETLWPLASKGPFLVSPDTTKDAVDLVAYVYPKLSISERRAFEESISAFDYSNYQHPDAVRESLSKRVFAAIGEKELATKAAKEIVASIRSEEVAGNQRAFRIEFGHEPHNPYKWIPDLDLDIPINQQVIKVLDELTETVGRVGGPVKSEPDTFSNAIALFKAIQSELDKVGLSQGLRTYCLDMLGDMSARLLSSNEVRTNLDDEAVTELLCFIRLAFQSVNPVVEEDTEEKFAKDVSWGSPAGRIGAATAVFELLAAKQSPDRFELLRPLIETVIADRHPAVRLQGTSGLRAIWGIDQDSFWSYVERLVLQENNGGVVDHFVCDTLGRLIGTDPDRVERYAFELLKRFEPGTVEAPSLRVHLADIVSLLWIWRGRERSRNQLEAWIADLKSELPILKAILHAIRPNLVDGMDDPNSGSTEIGKRSIQVLHACVEAASFAIAEYRNSPNSPLVDLEATKASFQLTDDACSQIYFASGVAIQSKGSQLDQVDLRRGANFLKELKPTLALISASGEAHTAYYLLQTLERLIPVDPGDVFDLMAQALFSSVKEGGFQYEQLGGDLFVRLVGVYLADYKHVFVNNSARRQALINCLESFIDAGWASARRFLYRLPELIQ